MLQHLFIICVNIIIVFTIQQPNEGTNFKTGYDSPREIFLGKVGNKTYFVQNAGWRDWYDSRNLCESMGLSIGAIETAAEYTFLKSSYQQGVFSGYHFTAGRDSHTISQFTWDKGNGTGSKIDVELDMYSYPILDYQTCLLFYIGPGGIAGMDISLCSVRGYSVLCEAVEPEHSGQPS